MKVAVFKELTELNCRTHSHGDLSQASQFVVSLDFMWPIFFFLLMLLCCRQLVGILICFCCCDKYPDPNNLGENAVDVNPTSRLQSTFVEGSQWQQLQILMTCTHVIVSIACSACSFHSQLRIPCLKNGFIHSRWVFLPHLTSR